MVQNNKILTVSYGTFSCTLEGFEDNFDTMKAIAEYFRDLAAEDRFFGAVPPTPDAEMMAKIAEREIARGVEARMGEDGITLRAVPAVAAAPAEVEAPAPQPAPEVTPEVEVAPEVAPMEAEEQAKTAPENVAEPVMEAQAEDVAEEIEPVSEPVSEVEEEASANEAPDAQSEEDAPEEGEETLQAVPTAEAVTAVVLTEKDRVDLIAADEPVADAPVIAVDEEAAVPEAVVEDAVAEVVDADETDVPEPEADIAGFGSESVAAKLARIRAVVAQEEAVPEYSEDEHASDEAADEPIDVENAAVRAALQDHAARATDAASDQVGGVEAEDAATEEAAPEAPVDAESDADDAPVETAVETPVEAPVEASVNEDTQPEAPEAVGPEGDAATTDHEDTDETASVDAPTRKQPGAVHVVKVKASAAPAPAEAPADAEQAGQSTLSPEDEADLMRELAEVEAEFAREAELERAVDVAEQDDVVTEEADAETVETSGEAVSDDVIDRDLVAALSETPDEGAEDTVEADVEEDTAEVQEAAPMEPQSAQEDQPETAEETAEEIAETPQSEAEAGATASADVTRSIRALTRRVRMAENAAGQGEGDVTRLMAETEAQLEEPEGRSRRSAIAHLRAAVAATREERQSASSPVETPDREAQFREDLDAVRPRAQEHEARSVAPLKLVAEQRVDLSAQEPEGHAEPAAPATVRPRRVAVRRVKPAVEPSIDVGDSGFMAYAEDNGARELPELLEAAAAYMTMVEKRSQFSRPQLMNKVREVNDADFSREDRLRFFGQLLREGKIEKTTSGRFTASEQIGFQPDARAAG